MIKDVLLLLNHYKEIIKHKAIVAYYMFVLIVELIKRAIMHDNSKFKKDEAILFAKYTPKLKNCTYNSDEYKQYLKELQPALEYHYKYNSHHPEHYGMSSTFFQSRLAMMNLIDWVEMLCDWKAATKRHIDGDIFKSININQDRFNYSYDIAEMFKNTIRDFRFG